MAMLLAVSGDVVNFKPTTGVQVQKVGADITGLRVDDITLNGTAEFVDGKTITGNGNITVTALDGDAAADLSTVTATGTLSAVVSGDVTFTGDLGTFAVSVDSGKTLTTTSAIAATFSGSGTSRSPLVLVHSPLQQQRLQFVRQWETATIPCLSEQQQMLPPLTK